MSIEQSRPPQPGDWLLAAEGEIHHLARYAAQRGLPLSAHIFRTVAERLGAVARDPEASDSPPREAPGPG